jgi:predicted trehalose synthase
MASADGEHKLRCAFCEATARVIPGPTYSDEDWLAFAEIDRAVFEAGLEAAQASALVYQLQDMLDRQETAGSIATRVVELVPQLAHARPALVNRLPRGLRMLMTLLLARTRALPFSAAGHPGPDEGMPI